MKLSVHKIEKKAIPGEGEILYFLGRDENRKKHRIKVTGPDPYMLSTDLDVPDDDRIKEILYEDEDGELYQVDGKPACKIVVTNSIDISGIPGKTTGIRDYFDDDDKYECDILYINRVALDIGMKVGIEFPYSNNVNYKDIKPIDFYIPERVLLFDIETMTGEDNKVPDIETANQPIVLIACVDSYSKKKTVTQFGFKKGVVKKGNEIEIFSKIKTKDKTKYKWDIHLYNTEYDMFRAFLKYYKYVNIDIFGAYNGDSFDLPYTINRMIRLNTNIKQKGLKEKQLDWRSLSPFGNVYKKYKDSLEYIIKGVITLDTMKAYIKRGTSTLNNQLTEVGLNKLGYGKVKLGTTFNKAYKNHFKKFMYYNAIDIILDYEIFLKMRQLEFYSGIRRFTGVSWDKLFSNLRINDTILLNEAKQCKILAPYTKKVPHIPFGGGYVLKPKQYGRLRNICTGDFKSLYPGIMIAFNMGFDTYLGNDLDESQIKFPFISTPWDDSENNPRDPTRAYFRSDKQSLIAKVLIKYIKYRDEYKQQMFELEKRIELEELTKEETDKIKFDIKLLNDTQMVIKFITNSLYGILGNEHFRWYQIEIAEAITTIGRKFIGDSIDYLEENGWKVNYGDTDSVMFFLNSKNIKGMIEEAYATSIILNNYYLKYCDEFNLNIETVKKYILMKPEDIAQIFFMSRKKGSEDEAAKKRYIKSVIAKFVLNKLILCNPPEVQIKGYIKSNVSKIGNKIFRKINAIIVEDKDNEYINNKIIALLKAVTEAIKKGRYKLKDICLRVKASKNFSQYTRVNKAGITVQSKSEHVDAGRWTNQWAHLWEGSSNLGKGSSIQYLFIKETEIPNKYARTNKVALDDTGNLPQEIINIIDYDKLIEKTIYAPLEPILREMDIDIINITTDGYTEPLF